MRVTDRNGSRRRLLATQAADVQLRIPKLRKGSFLPMILEPRRRIDQALFCGFAFRWWSPRGSHSVSPMPPPAKG